MIEPRFSYHTTTYVIGGAILVAAILLNAFAQSFHIARDEHLPGVRGGPARTGYCGCPNKAKCGYDKDTDCDGCCPPGPCKGGNPSFTASTCGGCR